MMDLELYRVFYSVAKCGSLTKAAEELFISQPAVSQAVKQMERHLGGQLFVRTHKGMELTESGMRLLPQIESALNIIENAEKSYFDFKDSATGVLRLCTSDTVTTHFLLPFIKRYHEKFPDVKIVFQNCTSAETVTALKEGKGDVGFVNLPIDDSEIDLIKTVMYLHDTFVAGGDYADLSEKEIDIALLQDYPLVMLEKNTATRSAFEEFSRSQGVELKPEIEVASLELMTEFAKANMGVACIPKEFVADEIEKGNLKEIKTNPQMPTRAVGLALPKSGAVTKTVKEFIKMFGER